MPQDHRIYLDNAATSWPKPAGVYDAVDRFMRHVGAPAGRGAYREAVEVDRQIEAARRSVARLLGAADAHSVVFAASGTDALHLALHGTVRPGDHVVTTVCEHHSVLRPLRVLEQQQNVRVARVPCDDYGAVDPQQVRAALEPDTRLVAMIHASNVTGRLQPVAEVGAMLRDHPALLLVDAAQTLGCLPLAVEELGADLLAAPGHKGLLGPLGTGVLYFAPGVARHVRPVRPGGTGTHSDEDIQPESLPEKYEAGNLNVPGILGLAAGVDYVHQQGAAAIHQHTTALAEQLVEGIKATDGVNLVGRQDGRGHVGVVSVQVKGLDPQEVAGMLDSGYRVQVRAGFHCASRMHRALGTLQTGGTVRLSPGPFNTPSDIAAAVAAMAELATSDLVR